MRLRQVRPDDASRLVALWTRAGLHLPPGAADEVGPKLQRDPDLFLVVEAGERLIASVMGSYDGRRGWVNRLAVDPEFQGQGLGTRLLQEVEARLRARGCRKVNLLIEPDNAAVQRFYERLGYRGDELIFMEKWLA